MAAKLGTEFSVTAREVNIDTNGLSFLTITGTHINGAYAAFPGFGLSVELSSLGDTAYNTDKLFEMLQTSSDSRLPKSDNARYTIAKDLSEVITPLINSLVLNPGQDKGKRINGGYEIIENCTLGDTELVIGHNPNAPDPYVCWDCNNSIEYSNGFYCQTYSTAREEMSDRYFTRSCILEGLLRAEQKQFVQSGAKQRDSAGPVAETPPEAQTPPRRHIGL